MAIILMRVNKMIKRIKEAFKRWWKRHICDEFPYEPEAF